MAVVVFDNDGGGGDNLWSTNTNWVGNALPGNADTADIDAACTLDMNDIVAVLDVGANTFTMNAGFALTEMTGNLLGAGPIIMGAGCSLLWDTAGNPTMAVTWDINGADGSLVTIENVGAGDVLFAARTDSDIRWADITAHFRFINDIDGWVLFEDCQLDMLNLDQAWSIPTVMRRCFIVGFNSNGQFWGHEKQPWENVVFGYKRDGTADGDNRVRLENMTHIINCVDNTTSGILSMGGNQLIFENFGHVCDAMLPGTGSALDLAVVGPGIGRIEQTDGNYALDIGSWERSTAAKKTGDYGVRVSPDAQCSVNTPLDNEIYIPIATGDDISVSVYSRRTGMTSDCAKVIIDPEEAWFTSDESAELLVNPNTWYELTASAAGAGGAADVGMVRIVLRVDEVDGAHTVDFADMVVTVT